MDLSFVSTILVPLGLYALAVPMPGPGFVVISRASISHGQANGAAAALGTTASVAVYAIATALGVSTLLATLPWLSAAIQAAGGVYLIWIGIAILHASFGRFRPNGEVFMSQSDRHECLRMSFRRGLLVGLGNPKMAAFFLGLFSPAMAGDSSISARLTVLGGVILIDLLYHQCLAWVAAKGQRLGSRLGKWMDAVVAGSMIGFGGLMLARSLDET